MRKNVYLLLTLTGFFSILIASERTPSDNLQTLKDYQNYHRHRPCATADEYIPEISNNVNNFSLSTQNNLNVDETIQPIGFIIQNNRKKRSSQNDDDYEETEMTSVHHAITIQDFSEQEYKSFQQFNSSKASSIQTKDLTLVENRNSKEVQTYGYYHEESGTLVTPNLITNDVISYRNQKNIKPLAPQFFSLIRDVSLLLACGINATYAITDFNKPNFEDESTYHTNQTSSIYVHKPETDFLHIFNMVTMGTAAISSLIKRCITNNNN